MSVEKLERVLWRLRSSKPDQVTFTNKELRKAIMYECGTDPITYTKNRTALKHLGWIRARNNKYIRLTNADLTGEDI
jgi:hypothetical protein